MLLYYNESSIIGGGVEFDNSISFNEYALMLMLESEREWSSIQSELYSLNEAEDNGEKKKNKFVEFFKTIIKKIGEMFNKIISTLKALYQKFKSREKIKSELSEKEYFDLGIKNVEDSKSYITYSYTKCLNLMNLLEDVFDSNPDTMISNFVARFSNSKVNSPSMGDIYDAKTSAYKEFLEKDFDLLHNFNTYEKLKSEINTIIDIDKDIEKMRRDVTGRYRNLLNNVDKINLLDNYTIDMYRSIVFDIMRIFIDSSNAIPQYTATLFRMHDDIIKIGKRIHDNNE